MNKEECMRAAELISEYVFTSNEYTPTVDQMLEALELIDRLIDEHFELVDHTTPKKIIWIYDDEPVCPACSEAIDAGNQDLCEFCGQRLDWSDADE